MILTRFLGRLRQPDQLASYYERWLDNSRGFHEFVFVTIESSIVVAALQFASLKSGSWLLFFLWGLAYAALGVFVASYVRFGVHSAAERFEIGMRKRGVFLWSATVIMALFTLALPFFLTAVTEQIIRNTILI